MMDETDVLIRIVKEVMGSNRDNFKRILSGAMTAVALDFRTTEADASPENVSVVLDKIKIVDMTTT